ncbi:hypothetical protein AACH06_25450 [Ideonella sp. DXS29W]|uniref:Uncharacterized protein n=1 Tax=Ideonella lacteola TaxID=2984193 RepID=A0ABU9BWI3_9BURK
MRFYLLRDDDLWDHLVEQQEEHVQRDQSLSLIGVGEQLYIWHSQGEALLEGLEHYTFPQERLRKAFSEEYGGVSNALEMAVRKWFSAGEQIFDLSAVSAMFLTSDALRTPIGRLKLPFESLFVHWGPHLEIQSPLSGRYIEGCYVCRDPLGLLDLTFVCSLPDSTPWDERSLLANVVVDCEGAYGLMLEMDDEGTIGDRAMESMEPGFADEAGINRWIGYIRPAVNMLANCLCYLSSPKSEVVESFPPDAPARLVKQATTGTPRERARGASKLNALGFRTVHLCGQQLAASLSMRPGSKEMPAHWRKGHWWPARIGKGRAEIRMDWRSGVVVNAGKGHPDVGHIYKA